MRILLVMDPGILVPPKGYGGIERIVEIMAKEYLASGHEVHLLVTAGSYVDGCTVHPFGEAAFPQQFSDVIKAVPEAWRFLWKHRNYFDLIHNFGRLVYLLPVLRHPVKKIMSYQREISNRNIRIVDSLHAKNLVFTACSKDLMSRVMHHNSAWAAVYNAIPFSKYTVTENLPEDAPLMFLGRIEKVKGCHTAIAVAKATGQNLIIAGNVSPLPEEQLYFENEVKPHIDGIQIQYVGVLDDAQKNHYLGKSKAMLFPIHWNEPFGIVMIEAMACGTPVIAYNKGSVEEVIEEGITGFKVDDFEGMIAAVRNLNTISRTSCREKAAEKFDAPVVAARYLKLFDKSSLQKKILIVTTGQPATNPRVMKEYGSLVQHGYQVKVLYTYSAGWAHEIDKAKFAAGKLKNNDFIQVGGDPDDRKATFFLSRLLLRVFKLAALALPTGFFREMAIYRGAFFTWHKAHQFKADLYLAHYLGALPGSVRAAKKNKALCMFDAEDYHRGEPVYYKGQNKDVVEIEDKYLPLMACITTASPLITAVYQKLYPQQRIVTLNNVFSKKYIQRPAPGSVNVGALSLFWFSQNIGANRGLEVIVDALNILEADITLYLLGNDKNPGYLDSLKSRLKAPASLQILKPVEPEMIFEIAARYDVGLASEIPHCVNRDLCLTNKIFTYMLAGNCVVASDTAAQKQLLTSFKGVGLIYRHNDAGDLARQIQMLLNDRRSMSQLKANALKLVDEELNWENEEKKLISTVESLLN